MAIPIDPATGKPYKAGEIPPGCNEPVTEEQAEEEESEEEEEEESEEESDDD